MNVITLAMRRLWHALLRPAAARPDLVPRREINRWRRSLSSCCIAPDIEVRGSKEALSHLDVGNQVSIDRSCIFWLATEADAEPWISIGSRAYIGPFCFLGSYKELKIGDNSLIGAYSYLITGNHRHTDLGTPFQDQGYEGAPIIIGRNVWLGTHVVILPGVTIGDNAIVGAGSVVTRSIPAGERWAGVPARVLSNSAPAPE